MKRNATLRCSKFNVRSYGGKVKIIILFLVLCMILTACGKNGKKEIVVGAAASLKPALQDIQKSYEDKYPNITVNYNFAGSGAIEQQIRKGAPIDVFFSAAEKQMDSLSKDGMIQDKSRIDLLNNQIVLIVKKDSSYKFTDFKDIVKAKVIAIGDPNSVPAGQYAKEAFESLGIEDEVDSKATYGKDVTEVLAWVSSGDADAGVVYKTDAALSNQVDLVAYAPKDSYSKVIYPAAVVKASKEQKTAQSFLDYLSTKEAKKIFEKYGFGLINN